LENLFVQPHRFDLFSAVIMIALLVTFCCIALLPLQVSAFGFAGHQLTATLATHFLSPTTLTKTKSILAGRSLSDVAAWADTIKRRPEYRFTSRLHYVNPKDNEPDTCTYDVARDCPDGDQCLIGALFNYTSRLSMDLSAEESLKFLIHYMGDLHQPLHVSGRERGGNSASARFFGVKTNLHSMWDTLILTRRVDKDFGGSWSKFADYLVTRYQKEWAREPWTACQIQPDSNNGDESASSFWDMEWVNQLVFKGKKPSQPKQPKTPSSPPTSLSFCFNKWAAEVNRLNCQLVWTNYVVDRDYTQSEYENMIETSEKLMVQAGVRMAAVIEQALNGQQ
jgi:hypothetical protein